MKHRYFNFRGQRLWLSPERIIFWEDEKALILSDTHFGKTGHFRKSGVPVPQNIFLEDLQRLFNLLQFFTAGQIKSIYYLKNGEMILYNLKFYW